MCSVWAVRVGQLTVPSRTDYAICILRLLRAQCCCVRSAGVTASTPLTFPSTLVEQLFLEAPDRPIAKCVDCSHRMTAADVTKQEDELAQD